MKVFEKVVPALLVALGLVALGLAVKAGIDNFSYRDRIVAVRGLAEKEVTANKVTWPIVCKEVGNDLTEIYSRITTTNAVVVKFLTTNGVEPDEIIVNAPDIVDVKADRYGNSQLPYRYIVTSVVVVTSADVDKVNGLIKRQTELLKDGVAITEGDYNNRIIYDYTDLNSVKPEMIAEATKNAREAADQFAADSRSRLGKIKTASQGQFSIDDRDPYTPWLKKVRVVTTIVYYLED